MVKFPRGQATRRFDTLVGEKRALFPTVETEMSVLEVSLVDGARVSVEGYGFQFANPSHPAEDWIVRQGPVGAGKTLLDILEQRTFIFAVKSPAKTVGLGWNEANMPPAFNLPYGSVHDWHVGMYKELIDEAQGHKFAPFWSFEDDNEHVAALVHSQVQDVMWLDTAVEEIAKIPFLGYFVPVGTDKRAYYAIIPLNKEFRQRFDAAWRRLSKSNTLELIIVNSTDAEIDVEKADKGEAKDMRALWEAKIQDHPNSDLVAAHPLDKYDLVLYVTRPPSHEKKRCPNFQPTTFGDRAAANRALQESEEQ